MGANERAQMLKYHIQTSVSFFARTEIDFNDIRTDFASVVCDL
jgi:methylmalonyl-CoA mutase